MANNFKNGGTTGLSTNSSSPTTLYTANNGSQAVNSIVIELDIANTGTSAITATALLYDSSATASYHIVKNAPIPSGSTLKVISGQKVVLNGDDQIRAYASANTADAIVSVLEDVA
tara:strand:- start:13 stop:360 length:348 start_codon:yes stop_codon:yes gene_type:complete